MKNYILKTNDNRSPHRKTFKKRSTRFHAPFQPISKLGLAFQQENTPKNHQLLLQENQEAPGVVCTYPKLGKVPLSASWHECSSAQKCTHHKTPCGCNDVTCHGVEIRRIFSWMDFHASEPRKSMTGHEILMWRLKGVALLSTIDCVEVFLVECVFKYRFFLN